MELLSGRRQSAETVQTKYALRLKQPAINNFIKVIKIDLERLRQHRANIVKFQHEPEQLTREQINASHTVASLKTNLRQLEQTRHQIRDQDIPKFNQEVSDIQSEAQTEVATFLQLHGSQLHGVGRGDQQDSLHNNHASHDGPPGVITSSHQPQHIAHTSADEEADASGVTTPGSEQLQLSTPTNSDTAQMERSWSQLEESCLELNSLIGEFGKLVHDQQETVDSIENHVTEAEANIQEGTRNLAQKLEEDERQGFLGVLARLAELKHPEIPASLTSYRAVNYKAAAFPLIGALVGGAVAGPVGLALGAKLGMAAGVGGSVIGTVGGTMLKKRQQQQVQNDMDNMQQQQQEQQQ